MIYSRVQIKAIFPIAEEVLVKMIKYVKEEIAKPGHDGIDAKDVGYNLFSIFFHRFLIINLYSYRLVSQFRLYPTLFITSIRDALKVKNQKF